jgi:hypothetical protein
MRFAFLCLIIALAGCKSQQQLLAERAVEDDAKCQSYGMQFGTPQFADCRMKPDQMREARALQDYADQQRTLANIQRSIALKPMIQTTCNTYMGTTSCTSQ